MKIYFRYYASRVLGPPDTYPSAGMYSTAWSTDNSGGNYHYIEVSSKNLKF